jgi:hypothetical protein
MTESIKPLSFQKTIINKHLFIMENDLLLEISNALNDTGAWNEITKIAELHGKDDFENEAVLIEAFIVEQITGENPLI